MATITVPNNLHEKILKVVTTDYVEPLFIQFLSKYNDNTTIGQIALDMIKSLGGEYLDTESTYVKYNQTNQFAKFNISGELSANQLSAKNKEIVEVKIGTNITSIGENAFEDCAFLSAIDIPNTVMHIKQNAFKNCSALVDVEFPAFTLSVDNNAFENCVSLSSIHTNNELLHIGNNAFKNCKQLKSINIPESIEFLGSGAFSDCVNLEYVSIPTTLDTIRDNTFYNCEKLSVPVDFLAYVTTIGKFAFYGCNNFNILSLAKNLAAIGSGAFANCKNLSEFIVDDNHYYTSRAGCIVTYDNAVVAVPCTKTNDDINILMSMDVHRINDYAFCGNENITTIIIPENIEHIGNFAFKDCKNLVKVVLSGNKPTTGFSIFNNVSPICTAYAYQVGGWKSIKIPGIWNNINIKNAAALD